MYLYKKKLKICDITNLFDNEILLVEKLISWNDLYSLCVCVCVRACVRAYIYIYISAVKFNALMQIPFIGTHFINTWLTQRVFSVWPMAQSVVGEMEMHSVAN